jgi:tRNA nucleotidyltransferase (CCA-adding enzyme)
MRDSDSIKSRFKYIATTGIKRSEIYHLLYDYSLQAIMASIIVAETEEVRQNLRLYLDKLRSIKPLLTGKDLLKMGVTQGPHMREILNSLLDAKLDDRVKTREDEERIVKNKYSK